MHSAVKTVSLGVLKNESEWSKVSFMLSVTHLYCTVFSLKIILYWRFYILDFIYVFVSSLWNICLININSFQWAKFFWELDWNIQVGQNICVSHNGKQGGQWSLHQVLRHLRCSEKTVFSSQGILGREPAFSQEEKGEGNISERGCARDHSERVWESGEGMR